MKRARGLSSLRLLAGALIAAGGAALLVRDALSLLA